MSNPTRPDFFEHDSEPVRGLPAPLPAGETLLWQGAPRFNGLARRALHLRWMSVYFLILALWRGTALVAGGASHVAVLQGMALVLAVGTIPIALLVLYGWASARSTVYTVTSRRVVIRTGVALPMTVNIPFAVIGSAAVAQHADGTGDIALQITPPHRVSWLGLWPHTRSWHVSKPQPTLRAVAEPEAVAQLLARALAGAAAMPVRPLASQPIGRAAGKPAAEAMA
ncbi:MAG: putative photosynthetic complex assembly protein PuhB [Pseudomonadota bacterium]|jgi:hypothetical protein